MKKIEGVLTSIWQDGKANCVEFETTAKISIQPGQFLMVRGSEDILPVPVYPSDTLNNVFTTMSAAGNNWKVGDDISIKGPFGNGFSFPTLSHRLLIVSSTNTPLRLLPLAEKVIQSGGEVSVFSKHHPQSLPVEVELLSNDQVSEAALWADCIIGDARLKTLPKWLALFNGNHNVLTGKGVQVLVDTPLVCAGATACGVCAVKTKQGWKQACTDGPVFLLDDLELD